MTTWWTIEFAVDDATDDVEGQVAVVSALCLARGIQCVHMAGAMTYEMLLLPPVEEEQVTQLLIEATRSGCKVEAKKVVTQEVHLHRKRYEFDDGDQ